MKIGVISDTHLSPVIDERYTMKKNLISNPDDLCELLEPDFRDVSAVIHAGDITDFSVLEALLTFGNVYAVAGNMDSGDLHERLGEKKILELEGFRIGLMHGWGPDDGLSDRIRQQFISDNVDCIVFGHSHKPYNKTEDNILMFNPGSPTDKIYSDHRTIGILYLEDKIRGELIQVY